MKARVPILLVLGVFAGLSAISCGGGAKNTNPAGPGGSAPASVAAPATGDDDLDLTGGGDVSASSDVSVQAWSLKDSCADGLGIRYRLFDMNTFARTKLLRISSGSSKHIRLACYTGHKMCVGAQNGKGGGSWGVGIDGSGGTSNAACGGCSTKSQRVVFVCGKHGADGGLQADF